MSSLLLTSPRPSLPHILPFVSSPPAPPHSSSPLSTPLCTSPFLSFHSSSPSLPDKSPPPHTHTLPSPSPCHHPLITLSSPPFRTLCYLLPFRTFPSSSPSFAAIHCICPRLLSSLCPPVPAPPSLLCRSVDQASIRNKFKTCCLCLFSSTGSLFFWGGFCVLFFLPPTRPRPALLSSLHPSISAFISHAVWLGTMLGASQRCRQMVHLLDVHQPSLLFLQLAF